MGKIVSLSEQVISKIAAGEVIERPAYIIKELIENAIDAQAQHIHIAIEQYGMEKIIITDDGHGMDRSDISVCFKPHTTSKISTAEDLFTVKSMGFRGEALASISSIGNVIIRSRTAESPFGTEVVIENGIIQKTTSKGMPVGTQIVVSQAFSHVPVRKKFLQSTQSEYRFIIEVIHRFIIAFPSISFDFTHDGTRVFTFPSVSEHSSRIDSVIPQETKKQLFEINYEDEYVKIYGYISPPQLNYKTPRNIQFYINNRYIKEPRFISVIKEVYGTLLEPTAHPYSLFFISLPHHLVDINVHPRKESIHMMDSLNVFKALEKAISSVLAEHNLSFYDRRWQYGKDTSLALHDGGTTTYAASVLKKIVTPEESERKPIQVHEIVQIHNMYLVIPTKTGMVLIDQHAAHERVLFERFQKAFLDEKLRGEAVTLKKIQKLSLSLSEKELLKGHMKELERLGFDIHEVKNSMEVRQVPALFQDRDIVKLIRDVLDDLSSDETLKKYDAFSNTMLEYLSCRSAIKAGDKLTKQQAKDLIDDLNLTENPYTCPHGRPIQIVMEKDYLDRLFKRK